MSTIEA